MSQKNKSVLFNTSASTDVQYSGYDMLVAGLEPINQKRILNFSQINYRAEVQQVVTIAPNAYTPVGNTTYVVEIGDVTKVDHGYTDSIKKYIYKTPVDITTLGTTPALQREAITAALVIKINKLASNYCIAVTLTLGNGFTVTCKPGYYPYNRQGQNNRNGAALVRTCQNSDGTGFSALNYVLTTAAVYEFGTGLNLLNATPVYDFVTGNLIAGEIETPVDATGASAVSGQKYNMFSVSYLKRVALPTAFNGNSFVYLLLVQTAFVDNGNGASATNLAGYINFERSMHRGLATLHNNNPTSQIDFLDNVILFQGAAGQVPTTTGENKMVSDAKWVYNNIGTNVITVPTPSNTGLILDQTLTAGNGAEFTPSLSTLAPKEFTVGKIDISVFARVSATTWANGAFQIGLRTKSAHNPTFSAYTNLAVVGSLAATPTLISTQGVLNGALLVANTTAVTLVNGANVSVEVLVNKAGVVTCKFNDVVYPVYSVGTTPLVFTAGTILVPTVRGVNVGGSAPLLVVSEVLALPSSSWKS